MVKNRATTFRLMTPSITTFSITITTLYIVLLWQMSFILSATNEPFMMSVVMLSVVKLNVVAPKIVKNLTTIYKSI